MNKPPAAGSTQSPELIAVYATNAEDTDRRLLADDDPRRHEYLRDYHRPDLIQQRIHNSERYQAKLADMRHGTERQQPHRR